MKKKAMTEIVIKWKLITTNPFHKKNKLNCYKKVMTIK